MMHVKIRHHPQCYKQRDNQKQTKERFEPTLETMASTLDCLDGCGNGCALVAGGHWSTGG